MPPANQRTVIFLTGTSGSGKNTALATFEDAGFYCIDNMPVGLVPFFFEQAAEHTGEIAGWVFVVDLRDGNFLNHVDGVIRQLQKGSYAVKVVFLDADDNVLQRRFSQTRRHHPLSSIGSVLEAIRAEKRELQKLRAQADHVIDTSSYSVHELKFAILTIAHRHTAKTGMAINVVSFGFKYGTPPEADMITDVRFLANPYFVPELKARDGEDDQVQHFVLKDPETRKFLNKYLDMLDYLIPLYQKEGKAYLTIAIGCTGGRHRSVVIARQVYDHICKTTRTVRLVNRDIGQP
jgi:UPF0042 nucleotide-binding protein